MEIEQELMVEKDIYFNIDLIIYDRSVSISSDTTYISLKLALSFGLSILLIPKTFS